MNGFPSLQLKAELKIFEFQVLDETLNKSNIESFKAADMYAFGLVLWEITRRTLTGDKVIKIAANLFVFHLFSLDCSV